MQRCGGLLAVGVILGCGGGIDLGDGTGGNNEKIGRAGSLEIAEEAFVASPQCSPASVGACCTMPGTWDPQIGRDPKIGSPSIAALQQLAPQGKLTVAVSTNNGNVGSFNNKTGLISGTAVDIACRMAAQLKLPLEFTNEATQVALATDFPKGLWNIGFAANPDNSTVSQLAPPPLFANLYVGVEVTYLVPFDSKFQQVADVDQPGIKIAVNTGSAADNFLTANLKNATLLRYAAGSEVTLAVKNGSAHAACSGRPALINFIASQWSDANGNPLGRTLSDFVFFDPVGPFMHQGNEEAVCYLSDYLAAASASGLIDQAIARTAALGSIAGRRAVSPVPTCSPIAKCRDVTVPADDFCQASQANAKINAGTTDADSDLKNCTQTPAGPYALGSTKVTLTCSDTDGKTASCAATVTVVDNTRPEIVCPADQTLECTAEGAVATFAPTASDNCGPVSVSCTPPSGSNIPEGAAVAAHCVAMDGSGNQASCGFQIAVKDTLPPVVTTNQGADGFIASLWPPNHEYRTVSLSDCIQAATDQCDGSAELKSSIVGVTSDEPASRGRRGDDIVIAPDGTSVQLRAARDGSGDGRVYTIFATAADDDGNATQVTCQVQVPHDQSGGPAVDSGAAYCIGTCN